MKKTLGELRRIVGSSGGQTFGPVAEERVQAAERELGLTFPLSYRLFLKEFGAAKWMLELLILGVPDTRDTDPNHPPEFLNVVDQTAGAREPYGYGSVPLEHHLIYFASHDGGGIFFYLDTSAIDGDGDAPVLIKGGGIAMQIFAPNFVEFLRGFADRAEPFAHVVKEPLRPFDRASSEGQA